jgi:hypothetical protein
MSRSDYAHWNEDADYMWWHEEGKHVEEDRCNADEDWRDEPNDDWCDDAHTDKDAPDMCIEEGNFNFQGHIAAPGYGESWVCATCDHPFVNVGGTYHDATTTLIELSPWDVI